ncbi:carboxypeptidase-like regulatory domain-containing protein [Thermococcus sp. 9N3]|uniref:carboxypeptidase-like regulatory domain-containing protein n=1 Tax=Thermococcus sp. 9N3 TaxID=163002 RepID=UPI00142F7C8E|nr:carboxypeptidase-like regulatory domain-containing protein [Thermococcus sp. 9N3]NJE49420.1 carboxypeptidase regulatory-like domain-containing protein [Thermococcus sp. 9N3]
MKKVSAILLLLLSLTIIPPSSAGSPLSTPYYVYYGNLLNRTASLLSGVLEGNASVGDALELLSVANSTYFTLLSYNASNDVLTLARSFVELEKGVLLIVNGSTSLNSSLSSGNYEVARQHIASVVDGISLVRNSLQIISEFSFGVNGSEAFLNTTALDELVVEISREFRSKENAVNEAAGLRFSIFVSKARPFVGENVTIFGYAPNMSRVVLHIGNYSVLLPVAEGKFSYVYSFPSTGVYEVYAVGTNATGEHRSNTVEVEVLRVPVFITFGTCANLSGVCGYVSDALGNPLKNAPLVVRWGSTARGVFTDRDGQFFVPLKTTGPVWVDVLYFGDEVHSPASAFTEFVPQRVPLIIKLSVSKVSPFSGEATVEGRLLPSPGGLIALDVYVDGSFYSRLFVSKGEFTLTIPTGSRPHEVYVVFRGNQRYLPARSNTLVITPPLIPMARVALFVSLLVIAFLAYRMFGRESSGSPERVEKPDSGSLEWGLKERAFSSVREVYVLVYRALLRLRGLPRSTTPRELLGEFRRFPFGKDLLTLTTLHELEVYRGIKAKASTVRGAVRTASRVLLSAIIGDEL